MISDTLEISLEPLVSAYLPAAGDIHVVVGIHARGQRHFLTFPRLKQWSGSRADENTIFEIGATTMAFTACLLADMVVRKEVELSDPIRKFLPAGVSVRPYRGRDITLLDLANHSSGLQRIPTNFPETVKDPANPCRDYSVDHLYAFLSEYQPVRPSGRRRDFSNLGMGLLGHILSLAAGNDYQDAILERIGKPLGLRDTRVRLGPEQQERFIQGHSADGQPVLPWDMPALVGAGGLRSTARELLTLLEAQLAQAGPLGAALKLCSTPRPKTGCPSPWPVRYGVASALAATALASASQFAIMPGSGGFLSLYLAPVLAAGLFGGFGPALLALAANSIGDWLLWRELRDGPIHVAGGLLLAWLASSQERELARQEPLGWQTTSRFFGYGPTTLWHGGETGGYASFIGFQAPPDAAVVVLANCACPVTSLGFAVLKVVADKVSSS